MFAQLTDMSMCLREVGVGVGKVWEVVLAVDPVFELFLRRGKEERKLLANQKTQTSRSPKVIEKPNSRGNAIHDTCPAVQPCRRSRLLVRLSWHCTPRPLLWARVCSCLLSGELLVHRRRVINSTVRMKSLGVLLLPERY